MAFVTRWTGQIVGGERRGCSYSHLRPPSPIPSAWPHSGSWSRGLYHGHLPVSPGPCGPSLPSHNRNGALLFHLNSPRVLVSPIYSAMNAGHVLEESEQKSRGSVCFLHLFGTCRVPQTVPVGESRCARLRWEREGTHGKQPRMSCAPPAVRH